MRATIVVGASVFVFAVQAAAGVSVAMAAQSVGGVGGDGNTNIEDSTGSTTKFGGGGSSFVGPAGTATPPGIVAALTTLLQEQNAGSATVSVDAPSLRGQKPDVSTRRGQVRKRQRDRRKGTSIGS